MSSESYVNLVSLELFALRLASINLHPVLMLFSAFRAMGVIDALCLGPSLRRLKHS